MSMQPSDQTEAYLQKVMSHQQGLYAFIFSLVHHVATADDVLQEVNLVLWRKREEYTPGTNFKAWAYRIAYNQVRAHRKKHAMDRLCFDEDLIGQLAEEAADRAPNLDPRRAALADCLEKLSDEDRKLIRTRYAGDQTMAELSTEVGRSAGALYQALHRIRQALLGCIDQTVAGEGRR
ncbi:MAG: sigma-70 family RNA polymerase sigma factor [Phycisphaeraceae bacterium]|nr:sigma-70 family RNA polymerase sigma factor [Phycisphaeraceae bacterium]